MAGTRKPAPKNTRAKLTPEMEANKWQKGCPSPNPGGRPKKTKEVAKTAEDHAVAAVDRLAKLVNSKDERVALMAAQEILDRAVGKAKQTSENVNHNVNSTKPIPVSATAEFVSQATGKRTEIEPEEPLH